ncbi:MAG: cytochrome P450, partial [Rhodococcus fascians]
MYEQIPPEQRTHIQLNPPEHTDVRRMLLAAVAPPVVKRVVPQIEQLGDEVLETFKHEGRAEMFKDWASPFPALATSYVLGFPKEDGPQLQEWVQASFADEVLKARETGSKGYGQERLGTWFDGYLREQLQLRRDGTITADDGISRIMNYQSKRGEPYTDDELILHIHSLIVAANETTTSFMSNVLHRILITPGLFERIRADRSLVDSVIEEAGRLDAPLVLVTRGCQKDTVVNGAEVRAGDGVVLSLAGANRDESVWGPDAAEFNPERFLDPPKQEIMTFGHGIHFCPGAHLARLETRIALNALLDHTRSMRLAPGFVYEKVWFYLLDRP